MIVRSILNHQPINNMDQIEIHVLIFLFIIHFLADFGLQTSKQAEMKSKSNLYLFYHVGVYSMVWFISMYGFSGDILGTLVFSLVTFWTHFVIDWVTSRISSNFFSEKDYHNGFVTIGFDQSLHCIQLILSYHYFIVNPFGFIDFLN
jgi:hypothetical protein